MTAVIGILNKTAVALAADSAVTISGGLNRSKVYNTANKIYQLSKYQPVGIAIYNAANFVQTPWEIVLKTYRDQLKKRSFDTVAEYRDDLLAYLMKHIGTLAPQAEPDSIQLAVHSLYDDLSQRASARLPTNLKKRPESERLEAILEAFHTELADCTAHCLARPSPDARLQAVTAELLTKATGGALAGWVRQTLNRLGTDENIRAFTDYLVAYLQSKEVYGFNFSGLVFVGYGKEELYPACEAVRVAEVVNGQVRQASESSTTITNAKPAAILPFAQTDVIDTIIRGVAPDVQRFYQQTFAELLPKYNEALAVSLDQPDLASKLRQFDPAPFIKEFKESVKKYIDKDYQDQMIQTTALLAKDDLAEMAESLIHLTFLKRRFMSQEESVGGPVDVAVISKGEGFIWIKQKFYFDPHLNGK
jgi:hypothetical protein